MITTASKVTRNGQVVIPMEIRQRLGIKEGDFIRFKIDAKGATEVEVVKKKAILDLFGVAKPKRDTSDFKEVLSDSVEAAP